MTEFLVRSAFRGSLNLGRKSVADEREAYKCTLSEETPIEKEHKGLKSQGFQALNY